MQNYTIDYEEYFNRSMVGCTNWAKYGNNFKWEVNNSWYCSNFTAYGNENNFLSTDEKKKHWALYYLANHNYTQDKLKDLVGNSNTVKYKTLADIYQGKQSFGQYGKLFFDVKNDTDLNKMLEGDSDDEDLGTGLQAIQDPNNIQELYLISLDGKERLFFRRKLVKQEHLIDGNTSPTYETGESLYTIQILRLKGFDAWQLHNFSKIAWNTGLYDGVIDTWACDTSQGFIGKWASLSGGAYKDYKLPKDADDCWVDLYQSTISLMAWNLSIAPHKDPNLAWKEANSQVHPYITFFTYNGLYLPAWKKVSDPNLMYFFFPLRTTLNVKDTYLD